MLVHCSRHWLCNYAIGDDLYQSAAYAQLIASMQVAERTVLTLPVLWRREKVSSLDVSQVGTTLPFFPSTGTTESVCAVLGSMDEVQRLQWVSQSLRYSPIQIAKPLVTDAFFNELVLSGVMPMLGRQKGTIVVITLYRISLRRRTINQIKAG